MSTKQNDQGAFLTKEGLIEIKEELAELKDIKRPKSLEKLATAREKGDLSENAEYTAAKEELAFIDSRIEELEEIIKTAKVIKKSKKSHKEVSLGSKITVEVNKNSMVFHLVGEWEADPMAKKISNESPLGKALIGHKEGEEIEVEAPKGKLVYKIIKIH